MRYLLLLFDWKLLDVLFLWQPRTSGEYIKYLNFAFQNGVFKEEVYIKQPMDYVVKG